MLERALQSAREGVLERSRGRLARRVVYCLEYLPDFLIQAYFGKELLLIHVPCTRHRKGHIIGSRGGDEDTETRDNAVNPPCQAREGC